MYHSSIVRKPIKQRAVTEFLTHKNKTPIEINWRLLAFQGKDRVDLRTARCFGEQIKRLCRKFIPERPAAVWRDSHCTSRLEREGDDDDTRRNFSRKSANFSDSHSVAGSIDVNIALCLASNSVLDCNTSQYS
jgi:hypothetical protein